MTRQWEKVEMMKRKTGNLRTTMRMGRGLELLPNAKRPGTKRRKQLSFYFTTGAVVRTTSDNGRGKSHPHIVHAQT